DAAPLPGHARLLLHLPHAAVRAGVRRGAAGRAADAAAGRGAGRRGAGHRAGEPAGGREAGGRRMKFDAVLDDIGEALASEAGRVGEEAGYTPAVARVVARRVGIALRTREGEEAAAGDGRTPLSIQGISKLFTLTPAMRHLPEAALWERIGRVPSGN